MCAVDEMDGSTVDNGTKEEINASEAEELTKNGIGAKKGTEREMNGSKPRRLRRYYCKICGLVRSRRELLKRHVMSQHVDRFDGEDEVEKFIARKSRKEVANDLKEREVTEGEFNSSKLRGVRRYCCRICGFVRERRKLLRSHIMSNHPEKMGSKDEIEGVIEKMHIEDEVSGTTTRDLRRYQCNFCGVVRSKRRYMRFHIISVHPENIGIDEEVNKSILKKVKEDAINGSKARIVTEEDEIDGFEGKKSTKEEINGPTGRDLRRYECKICGLVRSKRKLLELHMLSCHGEVLEEDEDGKHPPCVCDECGVSFEKPSHLQQHKLSHSAADCLRCFTPFSTRWETALEELVY